MIQDIILHFLRLIMPAYRAVDLCSRIQKINKKKIKENNA